MTWTQLDDNFLDRDDLAELSRSDRLLFIEGMVYANRAGTDGVVKRAMLGRVTLDHEDPAAGVQRLVDAGLWDETAVGWTIVGFLDKDGLNQRSAEEVAVAKARQRGYTETWRRCRNGDHSKCPPDRRCQREALRETSQEDSPTSHVSRSLPVPSRPVPSLKGKGRETGPDRPEPGGSADRPEGEPARCQHGQVLGRSAADGTLICPSCERDRVESVAAVRAAIKPLRQPNP